MISKQSTQITAPVILLLCLTLSQGLAVAASWGHLDTAILELCSAAVSVADDEGRRIVASNAQTVRPIASITKLMTTIVVLDSGVDLDEAITITDADRDRIRHSRSRIRVGRARLARRDLLLIALMSSANRAAAALGRTTFPGGTDAFVAAMNRKARQIRMSDSQFVDATGLDAGNQASADDLVRLVASTGASVLVTRSRESDAKPRRTRRCCHRCTARSIDLAKPQRAQRKDGVYSRISWRSLCLGERGSGHESACTGHCCIAKT